MTIVYRINKPYPNSADQARAEWVAKLMPGAESSAAELGVSPEAIIAQGALETGWGKASIGNNIFGVQALGGWTGPTQQRQSFECDASGCHPVTETFRDYATMEEGFKDHLKILHQKNFVDAGVWAKQGDVAYFFALKLGGYATAPNYVEALTGTLQGVKSYTANMTRVDIGAVPDGYRTTETGNLVRVDIEQSKILDSTTKVENMTKIGAATVGVITASAPIATAAAGMKWETAVALAAGAAVLIMVGVGAYCILHVTRIRDRRIAMNQQGIA
jgi:hypothetical protein